MEIGQLRTLIHVAELGSLSKAADRMNIAQPALSRQVRLLEQELGTALFERHGRGMVLTEPGREVLARATRIMAEMDDIRACVAEAASSLRGRVAVGMSPTVSDVLSVPLVAALGAAHPEASVRIVSGYSGYLVDWLHRGEVDVAILYDPRATRSLRIRPLLTESLFLIGPPEAGLSADRAVPFSRLATERMLLPSGRHGLRSIVERCADEARIALDVAVEADSYTTLKDLVRQGHGRTVLPLGPIHEDVAAGRLTVAPLIDPVPTRRIVLAHAADRPVSRLARFTGETIAAIVAEQVERGVWSGQLLDG